MANDYTLKEKGIIRADATKIYPSVDAMYGPWASVAAFRTYLGEILGGTVTDDIIPNSVEIGIIQSDGTVKRYEWQKPTNGEGQWVSKSDSGGAVASVNGKTGAVVLSKSDIGLGNVDNTSDVNKPISTATQTALNAKANASDLTAHTGSTSNPHGVTKVQVGLGNVDNTADADKIVKRATEDGSGNVIVSTYETKTDAQSKITNLASDVADTYQTKTDSASAHTNLQSQITAIQTTVSNLTGLDGTNFGGFSIQQSDSLAVAGITTLYGQMGYTAGDVYWFLAGTSMASLKAYRFDGVQTDPVLISNDVYDFTDFSGLQTKVDKFKGTTNDIDSLNSGSNIGIYFYIGASKMGLVSVAYDATHSVVTQHWLSDMTPDSVDPNVLNEGPAILMRTYKNSAWSAWQNPIGELAANVAELGLKLEQVDGKLVNKTTTATIQYTQTSWNKADGSTTKPSLSLSVGKEYEINILVTGGNTPPSYYLTEANLYNGSTIVVNLLTLAGLTKITPGETVTVTYTPETAITGFLTRASSSSYAENNSVSVSVKEFVEKYAEKSAVGNLQSLETTDKTSLVNAINEVKESIPTAIETAVSSISTEIENVSSEIEELESSLNTSKVGEKEYVQAAYNTFGNLGFYLVPNVENIIEVTTSGFPDNSYINDAYIAHTNSGAGRDAEITSLFDSRYTNRKVTARVTPTTSNSCYLQLVFSSSIVLTENSKVSVKVSVEGSKYALNEDVGNVEDLITPANTIVDAVNEIAQKTAEVPMNVFGDILPTAFKTKLYSNNDILIVCQGDSLTGKTEYCNNAADPSHDCPGGQYTHFVSRLQKLVGKVKPYYNRLDSVRDESDFFTKTGTWAQATESDFEGSSSVPATYDRYKDSSVTCLTYRSNSASAGITFTFDADTYDKCNIVYTKNIQAASAEIVIAEGDGKMLVSEDRTTWVEANGYTHSQSRPATYTANGEAFAERHRRLWMKKVEGVTGEVTISYNKVGDGSEYIYCWGTEMYKGRGIFFDNIGRGGRRIDLLAYNISDVFDRNPDLTILECPLANDLYKDAGMTVEDLLDLYEMYFTSSAVYSYKTRSTSYANYPLMIVLPHIRSTAFNGDAAVVEPSSTQKIAGIPAYDIYKIVWGWLHANLGSYDNVCFVNMLDQIINEAKFKFGTIQDGLKSGSLTYDSVHLNQQGSDLYVKYLAPIFQI